LGLFITIPPYFSTAFSFILALKPEKRRDTEHAGKMKNWEQLRECAKIEVEKQNLAMTL